MASPVSLLRNKLAELGVQAYFLPHNDAHSNEYLSTHDMRMPFLSGFKGSNGLMLVTQENAMLWTDGRYWLAAEKELLPGWTLMKITEGVPRYFEWVVQNMAKGSNIGFDPLILTAESIKLRKEYFEKNGFNFLGIDCNPVNDIWTERPPLCKDPVIRHEDSYAGKTCQEKLQNVINKMQEKYLFTNALDEIAWLLNLRGFDIAFNPVFFSYLLIEKAEPSKIHLFIDKEKLVNVNEYLASCNVTVYNYSEISEFLSGIQEKIIVDTSKCNFFLYQKIANPVSGSSPISDLKAIKDNREIQGFRDCHIRDGLALCKYFAWLEKELETGQKWTEYTGAKVLEDFRRKGDLNMGLSFETISSVGANAAIIHYKPEEETASEIVKEKIYLLDSGGHYLDGTTDTTRTVHFGEPSDWEKECYTRVLLGNLDLERMVWPDTWDISGAELDIMARRRLWQIGLEYNHGTGHGVGYFLNVHEGPQGISRARKTVLKEGMDVSDEPGYYETGAFGIRIENILFVQKHQLYLDSLFFENVTMVPYAIELIKTQLLDESDKKYINAYHEKVQKTLLPLLENDQLTMSWLIKKTAPIN